MPARLQAARDARQAAEVEGHAPADRDSADVNGRMPTGPGSAAAHAPAEPAPSAGLIDPQEKQVQMAMRLRRKYRVGNGFQLLAPSLVGFDLPNRDGIPINGKRCDQLLGEIADMGFDPYEADHDNVCVQIRPGCQEVFKFNQRICNNHPLLADVLQNTLSFATVSHSHLHQCLKNIVAECTGHAPAGFLHEGKLNIEMIKGKDPLLHRACMHGLQWEVLSADIRDEPLALEIIHAACNRMAV